MQEREFAPSVNVRSNGEDGEVLYPSFAPGSPRSDNGEEEWQYSKVIAGKMISRTGRAKQKREKRTRREPCNTAQILVRHPLKISNRLVCSDPSIGQWTV